MSGKIGLAESIQKAHRKIDKLADHVRALESWQCAHIGWHQQFKKDGCPPPAPAKPPAEPGRFERPLNPIVEGLIVQALKDVDHASEYLRTAGKGWTYAGSPGPAYHLGPQAINHLRRLSILLECICNQATMPSVDEGGPHA